MQRSLPTNTDHWPSSLRFWRKSASIADAVSQHHYAGAGLVYNDSERVVTCFTDWECYGTCVADCKLHAARAADWECHFADYTSSVRSISSWEDRVDHARIWEGCKALVIQYSQEIHAYKWNIM